MKHDAADARVGGQRLRRQSRRSPGSSCSTSVGMPASCISCDGARGDQRRGLRRGLGEDRSCRSTSAAAIWPVKMASGKFQGEMQAKTPRGRRRPGARPRPHSSGGNRRPRALRRPRRQHLAGFAGAQREELGGVGFVEIRRSRAAARRVPPPGALHQASEWRSAAIDGGRDVDQRGVRDLRRPRCASWPGW